jgi:hypothetical protein
MRKVTADEWMTLDGVIQAPGQADEDRTGGFQHGGWHMGYFDDLAQRWVVESVVKAGGFLHGRDHRDLRSSRGLTCRPGDGAPRNWNPTVGTTI